MDAIRKYVKKHRISYGYIKEETGYSLVAISNAMTGRRPPSDKFMRLLVPALRKYASQSLLESEELLKDLPWKLS